MSTPENAESKNADEKTIIAASSGCVTMDSSIGDNVTETLPSSVFNQDSEGLQQSNDKAPIVEDGNLKITNSSDIPEENVEDKGENYNNTSDTQLGHGDDTKNIQEANDDIVIDINKSEISKERSAMAMELEEDDNFVKEPALAGVVSHNRNTAKDEASRDPDSESETLQEANDLLDADHNSKNTRDPSNTEDQDICDHFLKESDVASEGFDSNNTTENNTTCESEQVTQNLQNFSDGTHSQVVDQDIDDSSEYDHNISTEVVSVKSTTETGIPFDSNLKSLQEISENDLNSNDNNLNSKASSKTTEQIVGGNQSIVNIPGVSDEMVDIDNTNIETTRASSSDNKNDHSCNKGKANFNENNLHTKDLAVEKEHHVSDGLVNEHYVPEKDDYNDNTICTNLIVETELAIVAENNPPMNQDNTEIGDNFEEATISKGELTLPAESSEERNESITFDEGSVNVVNKVTENDINASTNINDNSLNISTVLLEERSMDKLLKDNVDTLAIQSEPQLLVICKSETEDALNKMGLSPGAGMNQSLQTVTKHGLNQPDMMLEIPTQELLDIDGEDLSIISNYDDRDNLVAGINNTASQDVSGNIAICMETDQSLMENEVKDIEPTNNLDRHSDNSVNITENIDTNMQDTLTPEVTIHSADIGNKNDMSSENIQEQGADTTEHDENIKSDENICLETTKSPMITINPDDTKNTDSLSEKPGDIEMSISLKVESIENDNADSNIDSSLAANILIETKEFGVTPMILKENKESNQTDNSINKDELEIEQNVTKIETTSKEEEVCNKDALPSEVATTSGTDIIKLIPDTADEVPEISDSLGLLAESFRVLEDDEYQEDDDEDDEYCDDYPDDESSNQMTAEHSEDSSTHQSETDVCKEQEDKSKTPNDTDDRPFQFKISRVSDDAEGVEVESDEASQVHNVMETDKFKKSTEVEKQKSPEASDKSFAEGDASTARKSPKDSGESDANAGNTQSCKKRLQIMHPQHILNIVDLGESSSEEDTQDIQKDLEDKATEPTNLSDDTVKDKATAIDDSNDAAAAGKDITGAAAVEEDITEAAAAEEAKKDDGAAKEDDDDIEFSDVVGNSTEQQTADQNSAQPAICLEIFNLDSDEEDDSTTVTKPARKMTALELEAARGSNRCVNYTCKSGPDVQYVRADAACLAHFSSKGNRQAVVCTNCARRVAERTQALVEGIKNLTPLLDLDIEKALDLVEISDSESDDDADRGDGTKETIGEEGAKFVEEKLKDLLNETWVKFKMDSRLNDAHVLLEEEVMKLELQKVEVDKLLSECQIQTDKIRSELYATFEPYRHELPELTVFDTPDRAFIHTEEDLEATNAHTPKTDNRIGKRKASTTASASAPAPKKPAIPLGYSPLESETTMLKPEVAIPLPFVPDDTTKSFEDKDVSVVQLSVEAAPPDLPPPGEPQRPPLKVGMQVYAMRNAFCSWLKGRILECQSKPSPGQFSVYMVKFDQKLKNSCRVLTGRSLAYADPPEVRMTIGTRVIALFKDPANENKKETYYSGIIAEVPNPVNNYRYLVFFDDGYAQYAKHVHTRLVCESSVPVWDEVHPLSRDFVKDYLIAYPERPMVRLHSGQKLKTEWNGKWWSSRVLSVDASLVQVHFEEDNRTEWIYRGSTRLAPLFFELQAAVRHRARPLPRSKAQAKTNMPYVEYTRSDVQTPLKEAENLTQQQQQDEIRRQRAVAKKSTVAVATPIVQTHQQANTEAVTSRVVYYTPKNAVKPHKMVPHVCGPRCRRTDVLPLKDLRTYNPLAKPLLSGWERQIVRYKGMRDVIYRAPCGRRVRGMAELHRYLRLIRSDMSVDLFDFSPATHCLAEFVLNKCIVGKKDLSHGKENVPVPCVNYYDNSLPEFCSYNTERTPTAGVPLNLDPDFLCGCDCTDDCQDKSKCACWQMTLEGARTIGLDDPNVGYVYRRLPEPLPSGIYECNSKCKCKQTCLNRVAQHPLQLKLQVFKTLNRGWGIRALNDIPKGAFVCVYAGNLLTDATANLDGLNEGDEYLAELDYIEVVEQMKEGYEEDVPESDKKLDKKDISQANANEDESSSSDEEKDKETDDVDFRPGHIGLGDLQFNKSLRTRDKGKKDADEGTNDKEGNAEDDCITISDDEEVREPSRFAAQAGMGASEFVPKYRSVRSYFGKDEACYIMDAKVQGNIGRYLNHSCLPNVFVQNVFVDTHDPRFPWVAFFALSHIRAGTELTWNYNYDIGSVPEKVLYCFCGATNCRGRLL